MKRLFIVGAPRSGTTLLQGLIGCAPELATFTESHLFDGVISLRLPIPIVRRSLAPLAERFFDENGLDRNQLPRTVRGIGARTVSGAFGAIIETLDTAARLRDRTAFLEKTPRNLYYLRLLRGRCPAMYEDARFIHILRDGVAVAASLVQASATWRGPALSGGEALARWRQDIRLSQRHAGEPNHVFVRYEDLLKTPQQTVIELAERVGLALSPADLARREAVLQSVVRPDESWKHATMNAPIKPLNRAGDHVDAAVLARLEARIDRSDLEALTRIAVGHG